MFGLPNSSLALAKFLLGINFCDYSKPVPKHVMILGYFCPRYYDLLNVSVLITNSTSKLQEMLQGVHDIIKPVGLKMHLGKTTVICNKHVNKDDVIVDRKKIEEIDRYVYFGQMVTKGQDQVQEMKKRIGQGWSAFGKLDNIIRDKSVRMRLKRKAFNERILPVMISGCETWSLSNTQLEKQVTTQRKMERIIVRVTLKIRKSTNWIRKQSGVTDIFRSKRESKHRWEGGEET